MEPVTRNIDIENTIQILDTLFYIFRSTLLTVALFHPDSATDAEPWNTAKRGHASAAHKHTDDDRSVADLLPFLET